MIDMMNRKEDEGRWGYIVSRGRECARSSDVCMAWAVAGFFDFFFARSTALPMLAGLAYRGGWEWNLCYDSFACDWSFWLYCITVIVMCVSLFVELVL